MEIIDKKIVKLKVKNRWRLCLSYSVISNGGELHTGGLITLDKKWFMSCCSPTFAHQRWVEIKYSVKEKCYQFPCPSGGKSYTVIEDIIRSVDSILTEQLLLGSNPKLN